METQIVLITLISVGIMLAYAVPGFATIKSKLIKPDAIPAFATILMYVCQPCLTIYSLNNVDYSWDLFKTMLIFFGISFAIQLAFIVVFFLIFKNKYDDVKYRIFTIAAASGNCAFMGVPVLEAIMPDKPEAVTLSVAFLLGMNLIGWTLSSAIITRDKKYISLKKAFINPAMVGLVIALPLFFTHTKLPSQISTMVTLLGKMTTPLCMIIMGMRLATNSPKSIFLQPMQYGIIAIKQLAMPLLALLIVWFLPLELYVKQTMVILCATPVASVVLNFAEMLGEGQENAANLVLLGTSLSVVSIPFIVFIMTLI